MQQMQIAYTPEEIGAAIRRRRKRLGYTQAQVAQANGCSIRFLSELERGKPGAGLGQVIRIANSIGLDIGTQERGEV